MKRSRGFTLIELMVALAVLALIAALAFDGLRFSMRVWSSSIDRSAAGHDIAVAEQFLRTRLEALHAFDVERQPERTAYPVEGDRAEMSFSSSLPAGAGVDGFQRLTLAQKRGAGGRTDLIVSWRADRNGHPDPLESPTISQGVLIEDIAEVRLDYFLPDAVGSGHWIDQWHNRVDPPRLIRVRLVFPTGDRRSWPDLVVAPRATADPNCSFDVVSQQCRRA